MLATVSFSYVRSLFSVHRMKGCLILVVLLFAVDLQAAADNFRNFKEVLSNLTLNILLG